MMRSRRRRALSLLVWAAFAAFGAPFKRANAGDEVTAMATWQKESGGMKLEASFSRLLDPKQRTLIDSGFSTFSQLVIARDFTRGQPVDEVYRVTCTAKYDTWQERYDLARLDSQPQTLVLNDFPAYANVCLKARLDASHLGLAGGGRLKAMLVVEQISYEQANQIKEWLIRQQAGMIQGLFSHMLGDLTLVHRNLIDVVVPPLPNAAEQAPDAIKSTQIKPHHG